MLAFKSSYIIMFDYVNLTCSSCFDFRIAPRPTLLSLLCLEANRLTDDVPLVSTHVRSNKIHQGQNVQVPIWNSFTALLLVYNDIPLPGELWGVRTLMMNLKNNHLRYHHLEIWFLPSAWLFVQEAILIQRSYSMFP